MALKKTPTKAAATKAAPKATPEKEVVEMRTKGAAPSKPYKTKKFTAKYARMYHPDQKVYIDLEPVLLEVDSWTEVQFGAGLLLEA